MTSNKYAETLRALPPGHSSQRARERSSGGGDVSAEAVRQRIAGMIKSERVQTI